jgi:hypothetical protein
MSSDYAQWRPHPWHGLKPGPDTPALVNAYIEITPFDLVKYEIDKVSGYLMVDRGQQTSALPPALYGFIPRTYSASRVASLMSGTDGGDRITIEVHTDSDNLTPSTGFSIPLYSQGESLWRQAEDTSLPALTRSNCACLCAC